MTGSRNCRALAFVAVPIVMALVASVAVAQETKQWEAKFPFNVVAGEAYAVVRDGNGNLFVAGKRSNGVDDDLMVAKFTPAGILDTTFSGDGIALYDAGLGLNEEGRGIALDGTGGVYVAGLQDEDMLIVKFNAATGVPDPAFNGSGVVLYNDGGVEYANGIAVAPAGNIIVVGGNANDTITLSYSPLGALYWFRKIVGVGEASAIEASTGNIYVAGGVIGGQTMTVVKYDANGNRYGIDTTPNSPVENVSFGRNGVGNGDSDGNGAFDYFDYVYGNIGRATGIVIDGSGNLYVTGWDEDGGGNLRVITIKIDGHGHQFGTNDNADVAATAFGSEDVWDGNGNFETASYMGGGDEKAYGIVAVDGGVCVVGNVAADLLILRYNGNGQLLASFSDDGIQQYRMRRDEVGRAVTADGDGNLYVAGLSDEVVALKYTPTGRLSIVYSQGIRGSTVGYGVAEDAAGNVYVAGAFSNGVENDCFLAKYTSAGTLDGAFGDFAAGVSIYANAADSEEGRDILVTGGGDIFIAGRTLVGATYNTLVLQYTSAGVLVRAETYTSGGGAQAFGIARDGVGNLYVAGVADSGVNNDILVIKYTAAWARTTQLYNGSGNLNDNGYDVALTGGGDLIVVGAVRNAANTDVAILKYNAALTLIGAALYDSGGSESGHRVALDGVGNIHVGGITGTVGNEDILVLKYTPALIPDATFNGSGAKTHPGGTGNEVWGIGVTGFGNVFASGLMATPTQGQNAFILKLTSVGVVETEFDGDGILEENSAGAENDGFSGMTVGNTFSATGYWGGAQIRTVKYSVTAPATPPVLGATVVSPTRVDLVWTDLTNNESRFRIERAMGGGDFSQLATVGANSTSYTDTAGLIDGMTWNYRVRAENGVGYTNYSNTAPAIIVLNAPSGVTSTVVTSSNIYLVWNDRSGSEFGFRIERGANGVDYAEIGIVGAGVTTYSDTAGLRDGMTRYYRIRAYNADGTSVYSSVTSTMIFLNGPTGLTATALLSGQIDLAWTDGTSYESGFRIERSVNGIDYVEIGTVGANVTSYNDTTGLSGGRTHYYQVRAFNAEATSPYANVASAIAPLTTPTGLAATAVSSALIDLAWTDASDNEEGFAIERSSDGTTFAALTTVGAGAVAYRDTGLTAATTYFYRVRAFHSQAISPWSSTASTATSGGVTVATNTGVVARFETLDPDDFRLFPTTPPGNFPFDAFRVEITGVATGGNVNVEITLPSTLSADYEWYWYNDVTDKWSMVPIDRVSTADNRTFVVTLTDGGFGDADGSANGTIANIVGPGSGGGDGGGGGGGGGGGCFIAASSFESDVISWPAMILTIMAVLAITIRMRGVAL